MHNMSLLHGRSMLNIWDTPNPNQFNNLYQFLDYADNLGYTHAVHNGCVYAKVHKNLEDSFSIGGVLKPSDTWVKTGLEVV